jgi:DNA/RNA endonuclease G (NUC1)
MAASANYPQSKELRHASFSMANICPQVNPFEYLYYNELRKVFCRLLI